MAISKSNPKRWYLVMFLCVILSFVVYMVGPRLGYRSDAIHDAAIMIALWAPILGIMGVRAELLQNKN